MNVVCPGCGEEIPLPDNFKETTHTCHHCNTRFPVRPGHAATRGLFLKDLFSRILPDDSVLFRPTLDYSRWKRLKRNLAITVWFCFSFTIIALLCMSYASNLRAIKQFVPHINALPDLNRSRSLAEKIQELSAFREKIVALKQFNQHWWPPRMGLHQAKEVEERLVDLYLEKFDEGLLKDQDIRLQNAVGAIDAGVNDHELARYIEYLVRRINLIQAKELKKTSAMPSPPPLVLVLLDADIHPQLIRNFDDLYLQYLDWNPHQGQLKGQRDFLERFLKRLMDLKGPNLQWLIAFAENQPDLLPVTSSMFWDEKGLSHPWDSTLISPAYTHKGKDRIAEFGKELQSALVNTLKKEPDYINHRKKTFEPDYDLDYVDAWLKFSLAFLKFESQIQHQVGKPAPESEGQKVLTRSWDEWHRLAESMTTLSNPYYTYLDRLAEELKHMKGKPTSPAWLEIATDFPTLKAELHAPEKGILGKTLSLTKSAGRKEIIQSGQSAVKKGGASKLTQGVIDGHFKALGEFETFTKALNDLAPALESSTTAYRMAVTLFSSGDDSSQQPTPFNAGYGAMDQLQKLLTKPDLREQFYWDMLQGPMDFLLFFILHEAACELNLEWYDAVLAETEDLSDEKLFPKLFGPQGVVWNFTKAQGPAGPFFKSRAQGVPQAKYGEQIPFTPEFASFLRKGMIGKKKIEPQYVVSLRAHPVNVNPDASEKPHAVFLELYCSDGDQRLENFNHPVTKEITWKPDNCGGVRMEIKFNQFSLVHAWSRRGGFPAFLRDFVDGVKVYHPSDFPDQAANLKKVGIKQIRVRYTIDGHLPIIDIKNDISVSQPQEVAKCWDD